ncbi:MAG: hypothetical protein ACKV22_00050 [Bryobacteraceae bacterium]
MTKPATLPFLLLLTASLCLAGQATQAPKAEEPKKEEKKEEAKPAAGAETGAALLPEEKPFATGSMEIGYRWVGDVGGNFNAYRSVVDLGKGVRLQSLDTDLADPSGKLWNHFHLRGAGWGGDPYNTANVDVGKNGVYRLNADYRNMVYLNYLPSFANPAIDRGIFVNQRSLDVQRRFADVQLDLMPGRRFVPYLAFTRDSGFGRGITGFVSDSNEYPVANDLRDQTNHYRGGVRIDWKSCNLTLEQGGTTFKDDQRVFNTVPNTGNRVAPVLGQQLFLRDLVQAYGVRGDSTYSRALLTASPYSWLDVNAQFLFSQPTSDTNFFQSQTGQFVLLNQLLFYDRANGSLASSAKQPHSSGGFGLELRPHRRIRVRESWFTDRMHNASRAQLVEQLALAGTISTAFVDRLQVNFSQQQAELLVDVTNRITAWGGHRYVWGESRSRGPLVQRPATFEVAELRRHSALAGIRFRPFQKLLLNADGEVARGDKTYFRTGLQNFEKVTLRARYTLTTSLTLAATAAVTDNENPTRGVDYSFSSHDAGLSLSWAPGGGQHLSLLTEYAKTGIYSDIRYIAPFNGQAERSLYRDNAHTGTVLADVRVWKTGPQFQLGGTYFLSSGSRPTRYYQPSARVAMPIGKHVAWVNEWRWYGSSEPFYLYEGFRAHQFTTALRLTR